MLGRSVVAAAHTVSALGAASPSAAVAPCVVAMHHMGRPLLPRSCSMPPATAAVACFRHAGVAPAAMSHLWVGGAPACRRGMTAVVSAAASTSDTPAEQQPAAARRYRSNRRKASGSQQRQLRQQSPPGGSAAEEEAMLFIGFHAEELEVIRQRLPEMLQPEAAETEGEDGSSGDLPVAVVDVTRDMLSHTVRQVLDAAAAAGGSSSSSTSSSSSSGGGAQGGAVGEGGRASAVSAGRVVLLVGPTAQGLGAPLNDMLTEWGVVPALVAGYTRKHEAMPLRQLVHSLRDAHSKYYELLQPVRTHQQQQQQQQQQEPEASASQPAQASDAVEQRSSRGKGEEAEDLAVLEDVRVVLTAAMDAGEVPSIHGEFRADAGHLVVLDGLLTEAERVALLGWITAPGHNHDGPPPENKWEMSCVDRVGDQATWGLQPEVLQALRDDPPPQVVALQSRLADIYPEYTICHMPAAQISDGASGGGGGGGGEEGDTETPLSSFVGNAVMHGDSCAWHVDADPTTVPPHSPWVHNFGYYHNRELNRPLFVSVLLYLNETWAEDNHAETMFLDPETQLGVFVRPAPGRVVLMEQDVPHRISAPSKAAPGPRYSLVWKLVLVPKGEQDGEEEKEGDGGRHEGKEEEAHAFQSICRPEWGEPVRIGSANRGSGMRAFQPAARR